MKFISYIYLLLCAFFISLAGVAQQSVEFVENKGQWDKSVLYRGEINNGSFFLQKNGFTVLLHHPDDMDALAELIHPHHHSDSSASRASNRQAYPRPGTGGNSSDKNVTLRSHAYKMSFVGGDMNAPTQSEKPLPSYENYFIGNDPANWGSGCRIFQAITYKNVYPNIDVRYYAQGNHLKYDIMVHPGGNINDIVMLYEGVDKLQIKKKELFIKTSVGEVKELEPYSFQLSDQGKTEVNASYILEGNNKVKFKVKNYDRSKLLIIDPTLIFATFTGSPANQWGFTATYGSDGSLYSGGIVFGAGFPVSTGAFQTEYKGGSSELPVDIGIMKFNATGRNRVYATYIGGTGADQPHSLIEDSKGNLVILGRTNSALNSYPLFPSDNITGPNGGYDIIITKLNTTGSQLVGSKRMGGKGMDGVNISTERKPNSLSVFYGDDSRSEVIVDAEDNIYFVGNTQSNSNSPSERFPVENASQSNPGGNQDGVLVKLAPDVESVIFSTRFGGTGDDGAFVMALNPVNNNIYIAGSTRSNNLPGTAAGSVVSGTYNGGLSDGYIAMFSNAGVLLKTTYLGTDAMDAIYGVKFDPSGYPYVTGVTLGAWPVTPGVYSNPNSKQFIVKLQTDLSGIVYSTVFGSGAARYNISPVAFSVDKCENVYVAGWGGGLTPGSTDEFGTAGTMGMPTKDCSILPNGCRTDGSDFYFFVLEKNATDILFGAFYGLFGGFGDHVDGGTSRFDANGVIYQSICAACFINRFPSLRYPTTAGVWSATSGNRAQCNLAALKVEMSFSGVSNGVRPSIGGIPYRNHGCVPVTVDFIDTLQRGKAYYWDFGDGRRDTTLTAIAQNTYTSVGDYLVRLITVDSTKCVVADTSYTTVRVRDDKAELKFSAAKLPPCDSLKYGFSNASVAPPGKPFKDSTFVWDFGDGSPLVYTAAPFQEHTYASPGTYNVKLTLTDTAYCNGPETDTLVLRIAANVKARFETDPEGCVPHTAVFTNTSDAGQSFFWDFGDGTTSTEFSPTHPYNNLGTYRVSLVVRDPNTCNQIDSTVTFINVRERPVAGFTFSPVVPTENTLTTFTNTSIGAVRYKWYFGDGDTSDVANPVHQYNATGTFEACMIAYNQYGCSDTTCAEVSAIVSPLVAVPNAFSPNGDGVNDILYVRGYAIMRMNFRIYNRWGQLVFQSNDQKQGWDGKFNGVLQPMDAYAYTLEIEYSDGTKATKKGDITLLR